MHLTPVHTICCVATSSRTYYMQCPLESSAYPDNEFPEGLRGAGLSLVKADQ